MKAAVLHAFDEKLTAKEFVKYEDVTDPKITRPMDVIVRIGGAGVCRTDLHIVEGIWRSKVDVNLPYIMGHENAGWVEAIGPASRGSRLATASFAIRWSPADIVLPAGAATTCTREDSSFPGINANGGYAQYLLTGERSLIKLPKSLAPKDVAPYTDAGPHGLSRRQEGVAPSAAGRIRRRDRRRRPRPYRNPGSARALRGRNHRGRPRRKVPGARQGVRRASRREGRRRRSRSGPGADKGQGRRSRDRFRRRGRRDRQGPGDDARTAATTTSSATAERSRFRPST